MRSGIYSMIFKDGSFYIGKSEDIVIRAKQHMKKMQEGKHSIKVQNAFERNGLPDFDVVLTCHKDHMDILEGYYISKYWGCTKFLNTASAYALTDSEIREIEAVDPKLWSLSTLEHIKLASESESYYLKHLLEQEKADKPEAPRGFWERLFNWG